MKPPSDSLDRKVDQLLASRPLRSSDEFTARILAATAEQEATQLRRRRLGRLLQFALPVAAAITIAVVWLNQPTADPISQTEASISTSEMEEILLMEASLEGLAALDDAEVSADGLRTTFDILYLEI